MMIIEKGYDDILIMPIKNKINNRGSRKKCRTDKQALNIQQQNTSLTNHYFQ
jgi:hypothetical protein